MFVYKGGQQVKKGLYIQVGKFEKIALREGGALPGSPGKAYFRFSETCLLVLLPAIAIAIPMVLPLQTGYMVAIFSVALALSLCVAGYACWMLIGKILGRSATFGYRPTTSYLAGNKRKNKRGR